MTQLQKNLRLMDARIRDRKAHKADSAAIKVNYSTDGIELVNALVERKLYDHVSFSLDWDKDISDIGYQYTVTVWFIEDEEEEN